MSDGIGCQCYARCSSECGCENVDWTPREVIELRNQLSHLQKLCEEQRDTLDAVKEAVGGASLHPETGVSIVDDVRDLKAQVEEQKGELAGWVNLVKQIGLKVNCLYSNFSDDNGHILKAIDSVQSQLATQTERVQALEKELEVLRGK